MAVETGIIAAKSRTCWCAGGRHPMSR